MKAIITKKIKELYDILNYNNGSIEQFTIEAFKNSNIKINEIEYVESHNKKTIDDQIILLSDKRKFILKIEVKVTKTGNTVTFFVKEIKDNDKEFLTKYFNEDENMRFDIAKNPNIPESILDKLSKA